MRKLGLGLPLVFYHKSMISLEPKLLTNKRWYYSAAHWHTCNQCDAGNITVCNFCCFPCASP